MSCFSEEQKTAGRNIAKEFMSGRLFYALLMSECQAGKTGGYNYVIRRLFKTRKIERAYIVCGSSEIVLREQAIADAQKYNGKYIKKIKIIFHSDLKSTTMDMSNTLIIVDESHLVQGKEQKLHAFFLRHEITMDGNPANLMKNKTFIVSVDATPYSEIAAIDHKETPFPKHIEYLKPGEGYRGLKEFRDNGLFHETFDISRNPDKFRDLLDVYANTRKYIWIRLYQNSQEAIESEETIKRICQELELPLLYYTHAQKDIKIESTKVKPAKTTVIILRGMLRAGKVVPKQHIGFVWENSKFSDTDTIVQGLVGRMCGYHAYDIPMYVPKSFLAKKTGKVIDHSELDRAIAFYSRSIGEIVPRNGKNLMSGHVVNAPAGLTYCVPIRLTWDDTQLEDLADDQMGLKRKGLELLRRKLRKIAKMPNTTEEQKAEIVENIMAADANPHGRFMDATSSINSKNFYEKICNAHLSSIAPSEHISEYPAITFVFAFPGFPGLLTQPGASSRHVYALFYRVPKTTGMSNFSLDTSTFEQPPGMMGAVGISHTDLQNPKKLEAGLRAYLTLWSSGTLLVSSEWVPCEKSSRINKAPYHYVSPTDNDVEKMCRRLETEFSLKHKQLHATYARSGATEFNLKSISWK